MLESVYRGGNGGDAGVCICGNNKSHSDYVQWGLCAVHIVVKLLRKRRVCVCVLVQGACHGNDNYIDGVTFPRVRGDA